MDDISTIFDPTGMPVAQQQRMVTDPNTGLRYRITPTPDATYNPDGSFTDAFVSQQLRQMQANPLQNAVVEPSLIQPPTTGFAPPAGYQYDGYDPTTATHLWVPDDGLSFLKPQPFYPLDANFLSDSGKALPLAGTPFPSPNPPATPASDSSNTDGLSLIAGPPAPSSANFGPSMGTLADTGSQPAASAPASTAGKPVAPYDIGDFLAPQPSTEQFVQQLRAQVAAPAPRPANKPYDMNAIFKPLAPANPITGYFDANNRYTHLDPTSKVLGFDANGIPILQRAATRDDSSDADTPSLATGIDAPLPSSPAPRPANEPHDLSRIFAPQPTVDQLIVQAKQASPPVTSPQDQYLKATGGGLMMTPDQIATAAKTNRFLNDLQNPAVPRDLARRIRPDASDLLPDGSHRGGDIRQGVDPFRDREINTSIGSALWNATAVPRAMYQSSRNRPDLAVAELGKRNPFDPALQSTTPWMPDTSVDPASPAAAFGRAYARSAAPTVGGLAGAETFAPIGAAYGASLTPLAPEVGGSIIGGAAALAGAMGGGYLVDKGQEDLLRYSLGEKTYKELQKKYATDAQEHPMATLFGDLAPGLAVTRPSLSFSPAANMSRAIGAGVGLTQEGLQQMAQGKANPGRLALAGIGNAFLTGDHTAAGEQVAGRFRNVGEGAAAGLGPSMASRMRDAQIGAWMRDRMSGEPTMPDDWPMPRMATAESVIGSPAMRQRAAQMVQADMLRRGIGADSYFHPTDPGNGETGAASPSSPMDQAAMDERVRQELEQIRPLVDKRLQKLQPGLKINWNGKVYADPDRLGENRALFFVGDGSIVYNPNIVDDPIRWRVWPHELLHSASAGVGDASSLLSSQYQTNKGWEEGPVEALQRLWSPYMLHEGMIDHSRPAMDQDEAKWRYNEYLPALDSLREMIGEEPEPFYVKLLSVPLVNRKAHVLVLQPHLLVVSMTPLHSPIIVAASCTALVSSTPL